VFENVPGIIKLAADDVCADLERFGYDVGVWNYEAASVGAPHRRARIFFVAHAESNGFGSRSTQRGSDKEAIIDGGNHQTPRSSESSETLPYTGCWMRERGAITGEVCQKHGGKAITDAERPGCIFISDAESCGRYGASYQASRQYQESEPERQVGGSCRAFPDADGERFQKQQSAVTAEGERAAFGSVECCCGRGVESGVGRLAHGLSITMDGHWPREPDIPRTQKELKTV